MEPFLSNHRILEKIGEGGMGVVYRAEDTRLGREVAIKVLPATSAARDDLRVRLLREARMAAALNHPNLCTIHEVGELEGGTPFIVMELLRGETLHALIARTGALPVKDLVDIAVQIAEGVAEAHLHQIVHRDLKPQNVMVNAGGRVKVLDFGLAKPLQEVEPSDDVMTRAASHSSEMSKRGHVVGTAAYMSPEQALGEQVDSRSDVFSFGTMLYEMATAQRPFRGRTLTSTIAKILETEPPLLSGIRPGLPPDLERIIRRCLQKKPADRYNDTRDLVGDLKELRQALTSGVVPMAAPARNRWPWIAAALGAVALAAVAVAMIWTRAPGVERGVAASLKQITYVGDAALPAISPDGQFVAYATGSPDAQKVFVHDMVGDRAIEVFQPQPHPLCPRCPLRVTDLQWSPDGAHLTVVANGVHVVPRLGGPVQAVNRQLGYRGTWSPDASQVAWIRQPSPELWIADSAGQKSRSFPLTGPITWMRGVDWSPAGNWILFVSDDDGGRSTLWIVRPDGSGQRRLLDEQGPGLSARWGPAGDVIYMMKGEPSRDLWRLAVSADGTPRGEPVRLMTGLDAGPEFALLRNGRRLVFQRGALRSNLRRISVGGGGEATPVTELTTGTLWHSGPQFSPDGSRLAFSRGDRLSSNIFVQSSDGGARQITFLKSFNRTPVWSPDGKRIAFGSNEGGSLKVWAVNSDGGAVRSFAGTSLSNSLSLTWAPSPNVLYQRPGNRNFHILDPVSESESPLVSDEKAGWIFGPLRSPDGKQLLVNRNVLPIGPSLYLFPFEGVPIRQDMARRLTGALLSGSVAQSVDATPYRGKEVKLAVQARVQVSGDNNRGQCWLRVDRPNAQRGFVYDMQDRPIRTPSWNRYEIAGKVNADADRIAVGCVLAGAGDLWVDEFQLSVRSDAGTWMPVALRNASFEDDEIGQPPAGWSRPPPGYTARVVDERPFAGRRSLSISAKQLPEGDFAPLGWSADGREVYAIRTRRLVALPVAGGDPRVLGTVPVPDGYTLGGTTISPDGRRLVYTIVESRSDIWIIDDFDPTDR